MMEAFDGRKYSMSELVSISDGTMVARLNDTIKELVAHVLQCPVRAHDPFGQARVAGTGADAARSGEGLARPCLRQLCREKGFICEICRDRQPIYPFQAQTVQVCPGASPKSDGR